jgi:DNA-binding transcriptional ArsR family regulator
MPVDDPRVTLLKELADRTRLRVIDRLGQRGPATVTELGRALDLPLPQLSNHLRRLREAGLVEVERAGRHAIYALADPSLEALLPVLDRLTGRALAASGAVPVRSAISRTCYDHLGGRLGVDLYRVLRERGALRDHADGSVTLGPTATSTFKTLGVDLDEIIARRRRFAFECFDATEHAPHLAGALADALANALFARRWLARDRGRDYSATATGRRRLQELGVTFTDQQPTRRRADRTRASSKAN